MGTTAQWLAHYDRMNSFTDFELVKHQNPALILADKWTCFQAAKARIQAELKLPENREGLDESGVKGECRRTRPRPPE